MLFGTVAMIMLDEISVDACRVRIAKGSKESEIRDPSLCGSGSCN